MKKETFHPKPKGSMVAGPDVGLVMAAMLTNESYWDRTDQVQQSGQVPQCCGKPMTAEDDHGRFLCFSCGGRIAV